MAHTRWNHLSDTELLCYRDLVNPREVDMSLLEELFNRLDGKIINDKENHEKIYELEGPINDREIDTLVKQQNERDDARTK